MKTPLHRFLSAVVALFFSTAIFAQPSISSFAPASGAIGALVSITGSNLTNASSVSIGNKAAIIVSNTSAKIVAMVMPGAVSGRVKVVTAGGADSASVMFSVSPILYPDAQQANKLTGTGGIGTSYEGTSVAISADGNTAIAGGYEDNTATGAAWIYSRTGNAWTQQGKLVGTGGAGPMQQGFSVAISADGNTAAVGGIGDNSGVGATWIYVRNGSTWSQQSSKIVGTGNVGISNQGRSVALSADGNTLAVGGMADNNYMGAVWVFTRNGNNWTQQGSKLVGTGAVGPLSVQGSSVDLSADGNTLITGGSQDNNDEGAAWIFTRSGNVWTQQGNKIKGNDNTGAARQGVSVAISADGNTAIMGGWLDDSQVGAAWIFTRSGTTWTQQGSKLVPSTNETTPQHGASVGISADGNTVIIGNPYDNLPSGSASVFTRTGTVWTQHGSNLVGTGNQGQAQQGLAVSLSADGSTAIVGGFSDNGSQGASWIFVSTQTFPVTFSAVKAYEKGKGTMVEWSVATESNLHHYEVQHSANGERFDKLGIVLPSANNTGAKSYQLPDKKPFVGNNYYRVKALDNDGSVKYSGIVKVSLSAQPGDVSVFPNPVKGNDVQLQLTNMPGGKYHCSLLSGNGATVFHSTFEHHNGSAIQSIQIPAGLPKGTYSLLITSGDKIRAFKLMRE